MEVNGPANIQMLADQIEELVKESKGQLGEIGGLVHQIKEQAILLERYMLAVKEAHDNMSQVPYWHEVKAQPEVFPTNRERMGR